MIVHHISLAFRHLAKHQTISLLNFFGLATGLATAMIIGLHVRHEWQTDGFVPHAERVYRAIRESAIEGKPYDIGITSPNYSGALQQDFGEKIEATTRFYPDHIYISVGDKRFHERKFTYADPNFFQFFDQKLLLGDAATALANPGSVVLTRATANKLFGSPEAALHQHIRWNNERDLLVTGVADDFPANTHLEYDYVCALSMFKDAGWFKQWWNNNLCTYVRLAPGVTATSINAQLPAFMDKYFGEDFIKNGGRIDLKLQPLSDVYWNDATRYDPVRHGDKKATRIFALAALLLVVIACFNFINLSTSRAAERGKEVGVRKTLGASRGDLGRQFLLESFLLVGAAVVAAVVLAQVATPHFNRHFDMALSWQSLSWQEAWSWLAGLTLLVGLAAGFYPAALLSGFRPALALKQKTTLSGKTIQLRRWLTVAQFMLSITLIISTIVVHEQLSFIREKDLGFKRENVVVIETYGTEIRREKLFAYREKLGQYPTVLGHTVADAAPGTTPDASIVNIAGRTDKPKLNVMYADFEFADALGLSVVAGRNFDAQFATDSTRAALINESACRTLGVTPAQAIGMELTPVYFDTIPQKVVGVLQDYHFLSLHENIAPLIILTNYRYPGTLAVRVATGALQTTLATMQRDWEQLDPAHPFEYRLLDERLARLYETETQQGKLFGFFAAAAIFIACLGMFGLATLLAVQRTKEVGIRKVLGASVGSITALLTRDFLYLVLIALLVAIPVAYHLMEQWLADFAYRISLQSWMFAVAGLSAMAIALLTVGFQSIKAALANPVKSLRNE